MNIDNFRKQAKQLVRWHRDRNYSVCGRIRQLSRYEALTDVEVLALPFPLNEAHEVIALEQGFAAWDELKQGLKNAGQSAQPLPGAPKLMKGMPVVFVSDVKIASEFYRDHLGFVIDFLHGEPAFYGSVSRDEVCIHLRYVVPPAFVDGLREREQLLSAFVAVANVRSLFAEYQARNVPFVQRLKKEPWGQSSFIVRDPDGNWICFAG